jgi:hypothetical protein
MVKIGGIPQICAKLGSFHYQRNNNKNNNNNNNIANYHADIVHLFCKVLKSCLVNQGTPLTLNQCTTKITAGGAYQWNPKIVSYFVPAVIVPLIFDIFVAYTDFINVPVICCEILAFFRHTGTYFAIIMIFINY